MLAKSFNEIFARDRNDRAYFFRHGATKYNERNRVSGQHDTELTENGRAQAQTLRKSMPQEIDLIVCSSLRRSVETMVLSVPENSQTRSSICIDQRLDEVNLGFLQGRRRQHIDAFENGNLDFVPHGGESYRQAARRVLSAIVDIFDTLASDNGSPGHAVVFCHAGVLRIISTLGAGHTDPREVFRVGFKNTECLAISTRQMQLPDYWNNKNKVYHID